MTGSQEGTASADSEDLPPLQPPSDAPQGREIETTPEFRGRDETALDDGPHVDPVESVETADPIVGLSQAVSRLAAESEKYHRRATHREAVIDTLHSELETLRTGERRGTVRPLLVAVARVRDDLLRQAGELPADFDAQRGERLLRSFADSVEITLEDFGVATFAPAAGDEFDPRSHKAVRSEPTTDASLVRRIAEVRRDGYIDVEAAVTLIQAEVVVYVATVPQPASEPATSTPDLTEAARALSGGEVGGDDEQVAATGNNHSSKSTMGGHWPTKRTWRETT